MRPGRRRGAVAFTVLAASGVLSISCLEQTCRGDDPAVSCAYDDRHSGASGAALLQHHHRRSHGHLDQPEGEIFPDVPGEGCQTGSSCSAGGIPESRGACVQPLSTGGTLPSECWDICNTAHDAEDYTTGDPGRQVKLAEAVRGVRAGNYPHMRCPESSSLESTDSDLQASEARDILAVMRSVKDAEQAAERARLLSSAAKRESAALGNDPEGSKEAAEVIRLAAVAEAEAAGKALEASKELQRLSESRKAEADVEEAADEANAEDARQKEEEEWGDEEGEGAEEVVAAPTPTIVTPTVPEATETNGSAFNDSAGEEFYLGSGCCFSFGYAAMMEPCCLSAGPVANRSLCGEQANLTGGQTTFTYGRCPRTALEAQTFVMGAEVSEAANSGEPMMGNSVERKSGNDDGEKLEKELQEKVRAVDESLAKAKLEADSKADVANDKLASQKNMEALAMAANREARAAAKEVDDQHPDKGEEARNKQTLVDKAEFEAKAAATEAKQAASNASDAVLTVKRHVHWKRLVDCQIASQKTAKIKEELEEFEAAIDQLKALNKSTNASTDDTNGNLAAATAVKRTELQEAEEMEIACQTALKTAEEESAAAQAVAEEAKAAVEKAKLEEEDARNALSEEGKAAADNATVRTADCHWAPVPQCVEEFTYKGQLYVGCTDSDRYVPWCSHDADYTPGSGSYSNCIYSCEAPSFDDLGNSTESTAKNATDNATVAENATGDAAETATGDGSNVSEPIIIIKRLDSASNTDLEPIIKAGSHQDLTRWGHGIPKKWAQPVNGSRSCIWQPEDGCVPDFKYKAKMYIGCTTVDHENEEKAWCSMDAVYVGRWQSCSYLCDLHDDEPIIADGSGLLEHKKKEIPERKKEETIVDEKNLPEKEEEMQRQRQHGW